MCNTLSEAGRQAHPSKMTSCCRLMAVTNMDSAAAVENS